METFGYRLALDKDPEYVRALIVMGQTLLQNGQLAEATEYLERAIYKVLIHICFYIVSFVMLHLFSWFVCPWRNACFISAICDDHGRDLAMPYRNHMFILLSFRANSFDSGHSLV